MRIRVIELHRTDMAIPLLVVVLIFSIEVRPSFVNLKIDDWVRRTMHISQMVGLFEDGVEAVLLLN